PFLLPSPLGGEGSQGDLLQLASIEEPTMTPLILTADRLFDGTGAATLIRPTLRVSGERVEAVERGLLPPAGCSDGRLAFPGCTILPGLIDTHVHLIFSALDTNEAIIEQV